MGLISERFHRNVFFGGISCVIVGVHWFIVGLKGKIT